MVDAPVSGVKTAAEIDDGVFWIGHDKTLDDFIKGFYASHERFSIPRMIAFVDALLPENPAPLFLRSDGCQSFQTKHGHGVVELGWIVFGFQGAAHQGKNCGPGPI